MLGPLAPLSTRRVSRTRASRGRSFSHARLIALIAVAVPTLAASGALSACAADSVEPSASAPRPTSGTGTDTPDGGTPVVQPPPPVSDAAVPGRDIPDATGVPPADTDCVLGGRWLVAQRVLATAIGQDQAAHNWFYLEIRHEGRDVTVTKGLHCGFEVIKKTSLGASVDSSGAWTALMQRSNSTGRRGTFAKEGTSCKLTLDKEYVVRGASVPYYLDPSKPLPTKAQAGAGTTPGWEDWDGDGNPGISLKVTSALANGTLYVEQRDWTQYAGTTPVKADKFKVALTWNGEQVALGRASGSPQAIETTSAPSSDGSQHYAWFHKLADGQATGADADICASVRALKDQLVPEANQ